MRLTVRVALSSLTDCFDDVRCHVMFEVVDFPKIEETAARVGCSMFTVLRLRIFQLNSPKSRPDTCQNIYSCMAFS